MGSNFLSFLLMKPWVEEPSYFLISTVFDRDALRSSPTIHFVPDKTLVQILL